MTDTPLRANPEDRPLPPSGGVSTGSPSGGAPAAVAASSATGASPRKTATAAAQPKPPAKPPGAQTRPIGSLPRPRRDWHSAWPGFLIGVAALAAAIGLAWLLWDLAAPRTVQAPADALTPIDLAELEVLLDGLGFPPGQIDGVIDADGAAAIRDFQATAGLPIDGAPSSALLEELRAAHLELFGGQ